MGTLLARTSSGREEMHHFTVFSAAAASSGVRPTALAGDVVSWTVTAGSVGGMETSAAVEAIVRRGFDVLIANVVVVGAAAVTLATAGTETVGSSRDSIREWWLSDLKAID